jgi:YbgC/YbaW family acyl-CoA thioester hydrolase
MPLRVRYQECDGQGIVFNANYLAYVDMASFEVEKALFGSHADFLAHRVDVVVAEANLRYLAPCRFEDDLVVSAFVGHLGTTSLILDLLTELKAVFAQAVASLDGWSLACCRGRGRKCRAGSERPCCSAASWFPLHEGESESSA